MGKNVVKKKKEKKSDFEFKNPKLSVIVPVYNTEKYVEKCLDSLLTQEYKNIEIVVVEDCSLDNSRKILKKYEKNERIKIIYNEKNSGLSFTRNTGLKNSSGDYIGYIDSDDYVDSNYYSEMMKMIISENADIAICDMKIIYENEDNRELVDNCYNQEQTKLGFINTGLAASACNKVFKRELIEKCEFSVGKVNEDLAVVLPAIVEAKKVVYVPNIYYYYIQRSNSIQNSSFSDKRFDIFAGIALTLERIKNCENYEEISQAIIYNQIILMLIYVIPKEKNIIRRYKILKKFNQLSKKYNIRRNIYFWEFLNKCGGKHRLYYKLLFKLNCNGLYILSNLLISCYGILKVFFTRKPVIKTVEKDDLISLAKQQSNLKDCDIKISVVIPNYNYERFLYQRLYSILSQNVKIYELIILDDCSKDNSRELIDDIVKTLKPFINIKKDYNATNSGTAFKQWKKGFQLSKGDYVWIAEADDYCEKDLLSNLIKPIKHDSNILISYCDTALIDATGNIIMKSIKPEIDIMKTKHWNKSYVSDGINEIKNYTFLNCTISNVSSCLIKNGDYLEYLDMSCNFKQAGDWLFYVNVMKNGNISYTNKALNYYRVHGNNVSSTMNHQKHVDEIYFVHQYCIDNFKLDSFHRSKMEERIDFLKKCWKLK